MGNALTPFALKCRVKQKQLLKSHEFKFICVVSIRKLSGQLIKEMFDWETENKTPNILSKSDQGPQHTGQTRVLLRPDFWSVPFICL